MRYVRSTSEIVKINLMLEMKIGITGGEEDGVNNEGIDPENLYDSRTVYKVYEALSKVAHFFLWLLPSAACMVYGGEREVITEKASRHQAYKRRNWIINGKAHIFVMHGGVDYRG